MNKQDVLVVRYLTKSYKGKEVLSDFNLTVKEGEVIGLLGENGAGKSTVVECIIGTKGYDSGKVRILGLDPQKNRKQVVEQIGVQFQETCYQDRIKVKEVCAMTSCLYTSPKDWRVLSKRFGLWELRERFVQDLSGGERQRLTVLLALIPNPKLLFLDELTTGLDARIRRDILGYIAELKRQGLAILLVSHFMDEVEALCDRVCILNKGRTLVEGTIPEIMDRSLKHSLEEAYWWYLDEVME